MCWQTDWPHIRRKNTTGGDCQVITAVNIYHVLTGKVITNRYDHLVKMAKAEYGSAITIEDVWEELGIKPLERFRHQLHWSGAGHPLPAELSIWHKSHGSHSVACIQYEPITGSYRIPNFKGTSNHGWIYKEDLAHFFNDNPDKTEPRYVVRSFGLI